MQLSSLPRLAHRVDIGMFLPQGQADAMNEVQTPIELQLTTPGARRPAGQFRRRQCRSRRTCADQLEKTLDGSGRYYETHGLEDAFHPQTILAYELNGATLPIAHGAPLRLRTERTLGYKMAKYVMQIDAIDSFDKLGRGQGGFWEDRGYNWYGGI